MKIVIPGGTGQIGSILSRAFLAQGHDVVVLGRRSVPRPWRVVVWNAVDQGPWVEQIDGSDVVVNLAGRSVDCRYTAANRREILDSRVFSTRAVGEAIAGASRPPRVWLQASTATIYAHRYDAANDEVTGIIGGGERNVPPRWAFSIEVARAWEQAFSDARTPATRKVALRSAMTMSPDAGGVFDALVTLVRRGLGGASGDGRQFMSWIHHQDFVRAVNWLIEHEGLEGAVNLSSPNPLANREFMRELRRACGMPVGLPASGLMLAAGAALLRTETELILKSRRVVPRRLLQSGFVFTHPHWPAAADDLCREWRRRS
jgi:uncharacterized protein (TIGR01777 family)